MPDPQVTISNMRDLDTFFNKMVGMQFPTPRDPLSTVSNSIVGTVPVSSVYCYVSLEFVQNYYLKHLEDASNKWSYTFSRMLNVSGVYKVTATKGNSLC